MSVNTDYEYYMLMPESTQGSAVKTSAGYNWRNSETTPICDCGPTFIRTMNAKDYPLKNMVDKGIFASDVRAHGKDKPNVKGVGYRWMFDIDYLTDSMNYIPVSLENQANPHAGTSGSNNSAELYKVIFHKFKKEEDLDRTQQEKMASSIDTSEEEPKKIFEALQDDRSILRNEGNWCKMGLQNKSERGVVVRNRLRLGAPMVHAGRGIDNDEVFAHVASIEVSELGMLPYQSPREAWIQYGSTKKSWLMEFEAFDEKAISEHPDVAQSQPSSSTIPVPSTSSPPVQSPPPITAPIPASTPTPIPETDPEPMEHTFEEPSPAHQHFSPLQEHAQGQMTVDDLLQLVPQLMTRTDSLEKDLKQTKLTMGSAIVKLVKKVKKLEGILKRRNVVLSDSEEEEPEAQGRKSQDDPLVSLVQGLVTPSKTTVNASGEEQVEDISPTTLEAAKTLSRVASQKPKSIDKGRSIKVSTISGKVSTVSGQEEASLAEAIRLDTLEKEEEAKQVHLDSLLAQRLAEEEELNEATKAIEGVKFNLKLNITRIKIGILLSKLKLMSSCQRVCIGSGFKERLCKEDEVKEEFDKLVKQVESFAPINFEATKDSLKRFGEELQTKTSKRLKSDEAKDDESTKKTGKRRKQLARKGLHSDKTDEDESEASKDADPISGKKSVYQIVRENGTDIVYINFGAMLKDITRDDLTELYRIVMNRYGMNGPEDELEKVLWEYLKNMFEAPLSTDPIWSLLDKKLQGGKPDEDCYKMLKMMEKQAGIRK
ncbi:hypothetical protein Tco_1173884 [Tanacetum coccineum]